MRSFGVNNPCSICIQLVSKGNHIRDKSSHQTTLSIYRFDAINLVQCCDGNRLFSLGNSVTILIWITLFESILSASIDAAFHLWITRSMSRFSIKDTLSSFWIQNEKFKFNEEKNQSELSRTCRNVFNTFLGIQKFENFIQFINNQKKKNRCSHSCVDTFFWIYKKFIRFKSTKTWNCVNKFRMKPFKYSIRFRHTCYQAYCLDTSKMEMWIILKEIQLGNWN